MLAETRFTSKSTDGRKRVRVSRTDRKKDHWTGRMEIRNIVGYLHPHVEVELVAK